MTATPNPPSATSPINYCQNQTPTPLTASGSNLKWYTTASGGTGSNTAPTPNTNTPSTTSYWVSQSANNCESNRSNKRRRDGNPNPPSATSPINYTCTQGICYSVASAANCSNGHSSGSNLKWYSTASGGTGSNTAPTPSTSIVGPLIMFLNLSTIAKVTAPNKRRRDGNPQPSIRHFTNQLLPKSNPYPSHCQRLKPQMVHNSKRGTGSNTAPTPNTNTPSTTSYWCRNLSTTKKAVVLK
ncbi:MAG: hypothetical protein R2822_16065 [Spirosomataceae bacterium]